MRKKRLLVLGGNDIVAEIKHFADKENVDVIVTGNNQRAKLYQIASEAFDIDTKDTESMLRLIKTRDIDGVFMGGNEDNITNTLAYFEKTGLPCYTTAHVWSQTSNKIRFKESCRKFGIPVTDEAEIDEDSQGYPHLHGMDYPVVVKPVDGAGSRGVRLCRDRDEFISNYILALFDN